MIVIIIIIILVFRNSLRSRRIIDNALNRTLKETRRTFLRRKKEGQIPEMEKFVKFCGDIWKKDDRTPERPWIKMCE